VAVESYALAALPGEWATLARDRLATAGSLRRTVGLPAITPVLNAIRYSWSPEWYRSPIAVIVDVPAPVEMTSATPFLVSINGVSASDEPAVATALVLSGLLLGRFRSPSASEQRVRIEQLDVHNGSGGGLGPGFRNHCQPICQRK